MPVHAKNRIHQAMPMLLTGAALFCLIALGAAPLRAEAEIELSDRCPPYFSLDQESRCRLNSLYDLYPAVNPQWGGYRVALPGRRDGFTPQQIDLGRYLFFDSILSADHNLSCAHCHHPDFSLSDGRDRSLGRHGQGLGPARSGGSELPRAAPALWNMAFQQQFFWDGRAASLEQQIETVLTTPEEMANSAAQLMASLNAIPAYRRLFFEAFAAEQAEFKHVLTAIVAFESSLVSLNSAYDRYIHGTPDALTDQEINGLNIFRSFATRCSQCHTPPLFSSGQLVTTGVPAVPGLPFDVGAEAVTGERSLRGAFKVPSLRNVARSAPFMHAGQAQTLFDAVDFYNHAPGHAVADSSGLILHWHVVDPHLREDEMVDLVAFLNTLTDETALPAIPDQVPSGLPVPR